LVQLDDYIAHSGMPILGVPLEAPVHDACNGGGYLGRKRPGFLRQDGRQRLLSGAPVKRVPAAEHVMENQTEAEDF